MPVSYTNKNNFLEVFQALDFMTLQGITGASVHKRIHSMCNGANLAYTKKAFNKVGGFKDIDNIASGDDMLLMHKIYQQYPGKVFFLKSREVIVQTQPMHTIKDFLNQRIRWASKADKYDDKRIFVVLLLVYFFNAWFFILFAASIFYTALFFWLLIMLIGKTIVELFFLYPVARFFSKQQLLIYFPIAQPFHILYTIIAGWLGKFGSYQWKGREVK
jgi:cellulose synthase/poly-beta-1,6-N-acetylglucosamine synthase-like glycosyltransferase